MHYCKTLFFFILIYFINTQFLLAQQSDSLRNVMRNTTLFPVKQDSLNRQRELLIRKGADSIVENSLNASTADTTTVVKKKKHTPRGATLRSLAIPGWGQAYSHQYWQVPLAVAAVAIPIYLYFDNRSEYRKAQNAYNAVYLSLPPSQTYPGATGDTSKFKEMDSRFRNALYQVTGGNNNNTAGKISYLTFIQSYRNTFRQYMDYSLLAAVGLWGLQVADATVFAHLRDFDVSPDISMHISPTYFPYVKAFGIALNFNVNYRK